VEIFTAQGAPVDTGSKFTASVVNTGGGWPEVSLTLVANLQLFFLIRQFFGSICNRKFLGYASPQISFD
jgi:hypothetical protein